MNPELARATSLARREYTTYVRYRDGVEVMHFADTNRAGVAVRGVVTWVSAPTPHDAREVALARRETPKPFRKP